MLNKKHLHIQVEGYITQAMLLVRQFLSCHRRVILRLYFTVTLLTPNLYFRPSTCGGAAVNTVHVKQFCV